MRPLRYRNISLGRSILALALVFLEAAAWGATSPNSSPWEAGLQPVQPESEQLLRMGKQAYQTNCFICHGKTGDGQGSASRLMQTKPRNFTAGKFKLRTTPWGTLPTDDDLFRTISLGFPQYGMPSFKTLSAKDRWGLVYYLKTLMRDSGRKQGSEIDLGPEPPMTKESLAKGRVLYEKFGCAACHGVEGRADGPLVRHFPKTFEENGTSTMPRDFTKGARYMKSGGSPRDIARTLATGFEGSRMVSYLPALDDPKDLGPLWDIARYVQQFARKEEASP